MKDIVYKRCPKCENGIAKNSCGYCRGRGEIKLTGQFVENEISEMCKDGTDYHWLRRQLFSLGLYRQSLE